MEKQRKQKNLENSNIKSESVSKSTENEENTKAILQYFSRKLKKNAERNTKKPDNDNYWVKYFSKKFKEDLEIKKQIKQGFKKFN